MVASIVKRTFTVPFSDEQSVDISIGEPDLRADNLNLTTWTSSFILASQLHKLDVVFQDDGNIPILELGAGTALVGITAAALWKQGAVLTDLVGIVPGLRTNVTLNAEILARAAINVECGALDWTKPEDLVLETNGKFAASSTKASVIFGADVIYDEAHPELLSNVILIWLARTPNARAILTYPLRACYLDQIREIWTLLENGGLVEDSHGQERADEKDWDDECLCEWVVWKWKNP